METKPGYFTTEFWASLITGVYLTLNSSGAIDQIPKSWSAVALAIVSGAYAISRGQAKQGVKPDAKAKPKAK
jgi:hypothetical protein